MTMPTSDQKPAAKLADVIKTAKDLVDARCLLNMVNGGGALSVALNADRSDGDYRDDGRMKITDAMKHSMRDWLVPLVKKHEQAMLDAGIDPGSTGKEWDDINTAFFAIINGYR